MSEAAKDFPVLKTLCEDVGDIDDEELEKLVSTLGPPKLLDWVRKVNRAISPTGLMSQLPMAPLELLERLDYMGQPKAYELLQEHLLKDTSLIQ
jgi:hypothetical protein